MAYTKVHSIKVSLKKALDYIMNEKKTDGKMMLWMIILLLILAGIFAGAYAIGGWSALKAMIIISVVGSIITIALTNINLIKK